MVLYLAVRKRLERKEGGFSLGRFELPVAVAALVWVAFVAVRAGHPRRPRSRPDRGRPVLAGGVYFAYMIVFNREVLESEPGVDDCVATTTQIPA